MQIAIVATISRSNGQCLGFFGHGGPPSIKIQRIKLSEGAYVSCNIGSCFGENFSIHSGEHFAIGNLLSSLFANADISHSN